MRVLIVGGGGREHALAWKLRQSPEISELYCAPGNPGLRELGDLVPMRPDEIQRLAGFADDLSIDLTVVGPELPLTLGIVDEFERRGLAIYGPRREAAELEASKVFAKQFMVRHDIPTAAFEVAHDRTQAERAAHGFGLPVVLKADGLAAGKGVIIPETDEELQAGLDIFFEERRFGTSGDRVLVEEFVRGHEVSFMVLSDGERVLPLAAVRDYKRIGEGDTGPNTGGMGAHSPSGVVERDIGGKILETIVRPTIDGLAEEQRPFRGVLYCGLMVTSAGPIVLEYNVRFGDPETQALMLRLEDDLLPVLVGGAAGNFGVSRLQFKKEASACVVLASRGYPGTPVKGDVITGIAKAKTIPGLEVFHAATAIRHDQLVTNGGRVLTVCATGATLREALKRVYTAAQTIDWPNKVLRRDIGRAVLESASGEYRTPP